MKSQSLISFLLTFSSTQCERIHTMAAHESCGNVRVAIPESNTEMRV
jgi:hypothetical protein